MNDVMMNFKVGQKDSYLSEEQLRDMCSLAFASTPTNPNVSGKYLHVNTKTVIDDLAKLGWFPVNAGQRKARKGKTTIHSKHMVAFQHPDIIVKGKNGDDAFPRIILQNSHDGFTAFKFSVGIYRLVCSNGLVIADEEFGDFRIRHQGYSFEELRSLVMQTVENLPSRVEVMSRMKDRILSFEEKCKLAMDSLLLRSGITPGSEQASKIIYDNQTLEDLLTPTRKEDEYEDLWTVLNVVQEKIINGGFHAALLGAKVRKVKSIKSFEKDLKINRELFKLSVSYLN